MKRFLNILLAALLVLIIGQVASAALDRAERQADFRLLEAEARRLYEGLGRYHQKHGEFPNAHAAPGFDLRTLEPLNKLGYYRGNATAYLIDQRIDGYDSPDDRGPNQEFWIEMTFAADPTTRYVIARSDDAPSGGGRWLDGVYLCRAGRVKRL